MVTGTDTEPPLLEVSHQSVTIATEAGELRPVDDVSFTLRRGETLGIVGESGSGKAMLVRSLMNILPPGGRTDADSTVRFEGTVLWGRSGDPTLSVSIDAWESYLEDAA